MSKKPLGPTPWQPLEPTKADVIALKMVAAGKGDEFHQKRLVDWIINNACETYGLSFRPEEAGGDRATAFAEGRRFVGLQLVKLLKSNPNDFTKE